MRGCESLSGSGLKLHCPGRMKLWLMISAHANRHPYLDQGKALPFPWICGIGILDMALSICHTLSARCCVLGSTTPGNISSITFGQPTGASLLSQPTRCLQLSLYIVDTSGISNILGSPLPLRFPFQSFLHSSLRSYIRKSQLCYTLLSLIRIPLEFLCKP